MELACPIHNRPASNLARLSRSVSSAAAFKRMGSYRQKSHDIVGGQRPGELKDRHQANKNSSKITARDKLAWSTTVSESKPGSPSTPNGDIQVNRQITLDDEFDRETPKQRSVVIALNKMPSRGGNDGRSTTAQSIGGHHAPGNAGMRRHRRKIKKKRTGSSSALVETFRRMNELEWWLQHHTTLGNPNYTFRRVLIPVFSIFILFQVYFVLPIPHTQNVLTASIFSWMTTFIVFLFVVFTWLLMPSEKELFYDFFLIRSGMSLPFIPFFE